MRLKSWKLCSDFQRHWKEINKFCQFATKFSAHSYFRPMRNINMATRHCTLLNFTRYMCSHTILQNRYHTYIKLFYTFITKSNRCNKWNYAIRQKPRLGKSPTFIKYRVLHICFECPWWIWWLLTYIKLMSRILLCYAPNFGHEI